MRTSLTPHRMRQEIIRERILDQLSRMSAGKPGPAFEDAKKRFVRAAVREGKRRGLKIWNDTNVQMEETALHSLEYLLGERVVMTRGQKHTRGGKGWVLDLWEAALDDLARWTPWRPEEPPACGGSDTASECTIRVVKEPERPRPLSLRLLEAWTEGDEDAFLELVLEAEEREASSVAGEGEETTTTGGV